MKGKLIKIATSKWLALAFRLYIGGVFIYASAYKISYAGEFAGSIASYQIVPYWGVNFMAVTLPWLELVLGTLLVAGVRVKSVAAMIAGLMSVFTLAVAVNLVRGTPIGCGCFHAMEDPMSLATLFRDLAWTAMALHACRYDRAFQLERNIRMRTEEIRP